MSKKLSRSKRRELRDKGELEPRRSAPRRDDEDATSSRAHTARVETAADADQEEARDEAPKAKAGRDRTVLVLVALTALAALIFWLTQRTPSKDTATIDVKAPSAPATGSAKP